MRVERNSENTVDRRPLVDIGKLGGGRTWTLSTLLDKLEVDLYMLRVMVLHEITREGGRSC
jgi:hypothetical protein